MAMAEGSDQIMEIIIERAFEENLEILFPEDFMIDIFKLLARREIGASAGIEPFGYSLTTKQFYEFTDEYKPSEDVRGGIIVHNYPYLAKIAKLNVVEKKYFVPTELEGNLSDANRAFSFIATRR